MSPLHLVAKYGFRDCLLELLKHGADVRAACKRGETALDVAAINDHIEIVQALLDAGASASATLTWVLT